MWTRGCAWRGHAPKKLAIRGHEEARGGVTRLKLAIRGHEEARGEATCLKLAQIQILLHLCASSRNTFFVRAIIVQGEFELNILAQVWFEAMCVIAVPKVSQADEHRELAHIQILLHLSASSRKRKTHIFCQSYYCTR